MALGWVLLTVAPEVEAEVDVYLPLDFDAWIYGPQISKQLSNRPYSVLNRAG